MEDDEDSTPPPRMNETPEKQAVAAVLNLASALNGVSQKLVQLAHAIRRVGLTPQIRATIGRELRDNVRDAGEAAAQAIDPR